MKSFNDWLLEKDPEFHEGLNLRQMGSWVAKKGLPFAMNAYFAVADPINHVTQQNPLRIMNQGSKLTYADDFIAQQQSDIRRHRLQKGKSIRRRVRPDGNFPVGPDL